MFIQLTLSIAIGVTNNMYLPNAIELWWRYDLLSPKEPGRMFSRAGYRVVVSPGQIQSAQSEFAKGAKDLVFTARRGYTEKGKPEYTLDGYRIIG
jgi:hypothetical protein